MNRNAGHTLNRCARPVSAETAARAAHSTGRAVSAFEAAVVLMQAA